MFDHVLGIATWPSPSGAIAQPPKQGGIATQNIIVNNIHTHVARPDAHMHAHGIGKFLMLSNKLVEIGDVCLFFLLFLLL
eukprot:m.38812 g.38812  ORF g.38812 m.38812 type:complete len:80 (+) comp18018_c1_seq1:1643-1882(+)